MGWSCTKAANDTMERLTDACILATGSQNRFESSGAFFFWEYDPVSHEDGRITGTVLVERDFDRCVAYCTFTILPDGRLTGGHTWMGRAVRAR
jgi:hypothetical protein